MEKIMGFNRNNFIRIREEYEKKHLVAEGAADARRKEIWEKYPRIAEIDRKMAGTGLDVFRAAIDGKPIGDIRRENEALAAERTRLLAIAGYPADYTDPKYDCPICHDSGYVGYRMCACMRRRLVEAGYESSGVGNLMKTQSFDNFRLDYYRSVKGAYDLMKFNFETLKTYAENFSVGASDQKPSPSLTLIGGTGLGKTHLSTAVAKTVIDHGYDVVYVSAIDLFAEFDDDRFRSRTTETDIDRYFDCDLLILDDLGTEVQTKLTVSNLYRLMNERINRLLPTIISTNLDPIKLKETYGDRIASRLCGEFRPLIFSGTDVRMLKIGQN